MNRLFLFLKQFLILIILIVVWLLVSVLGISKVNETLGMVVFFCGFVILLIRFVVKTIKLMKIPSLQKNEPKVKSNEKEKQLKNNQVNAERAAARKAKLEERERKRVKIQEEREQKKRVKQAKIAKYEFLTNGLAQDLSNWLSNWIRTNPELWEDYKAGLRLHRENPEDISEEEYFENINRPLMFLSSAFHFEFANGPCPETEANFFKAVESIKQANGFVNGCFDKIEKMIRDEQVTYMTMRSTKFRDCFRFIQTRLNGNSGIKQTDLYKEVKGVMTRDEASTTLYFAEKIDLIKREKSGRTYTVSRNKEVSPPEGMGLWTLEMYDITHLENLKYD